MALTRLLNMIAQSMSTTTTTMLLRLSDQVETQTLWLSTSCQFVFCTSGESFFFVFSNRCLFLRYSIANKGWFTDCVCLHLRFLFRAVYTQVQTSAFWPSPVEKWQKAIEEENCKGNESPEKLDRTHNLFISVFGWLVINICFLPNCALM